jgi:pimeloyl-ACP methyl ester carboxylesterase
MGATLATREGTVTLPDGRRLACSSGGARGGLPVIYLHGAIGTPVRRTPELDALIAALGIHYIAVSRPGFGRSDPCPGRRIADFPADVEYLADHLGLGRFAVVGVSAGGPYALACARALPERAIATAAVSSLSPLCAPHAGRWMPVHLRLALRALVRRPDLVARSGVRVMKALERHPQALGRLATLGATPADRRLLAGGEMGATAIDSFLAAAAGGVDGMIDDYVACCTAWGFDLREVLGEVHVWHGERDRFVPVEHARAVAAALPRCRARFDAQDGHFFFRRRVAEVLGALVAAAGLRSGQTRSRAVRPSAEESISKREVSWRAIHSPAPATCSAVHSSRGCRGAGW